MEGVDLNIQSEGAFINKGWDIMLFLTEWYVAWKVMIIWRANLSFLLQSRVESTCLPPMCPRFNWQTWYHTWVEFVVGSLHFSKRFFSGYSGFSLSSKTKISKFRSWNAQAFLNKFLWPPWFPLGTGKQITFFLHSLCECKFKVVLALNIWYAKKNHCTLCRLE